MVTSQQSIQKVVIRMKVACFVGYEPFLLGADWDESSPAAQQLKAVIRVEVEKLIQRGYTRFLCSFNRGADHLFAEAVIALKARYLVRLESVLPHEEQAAEWPESARERYFNLLAGCDDETLLQTRYSAGCQLRAVKYMVDHADLLIAVYDGKVSGTMEAVRRAKAESKPIICIDPSSLKVNE